MNVGMPQPAAWGDMSHPAPGSMYMQQQQPMSQDRLLFDRPHAIATFGFGGKLFTLIPQRKRLLNVYGQAVPTSKPKPRLTLPDSLILHSLRQRSTLKDLLKYTRLMSFSARIAL